MEGSNKVVTTGMDAADILIANVLDGSTNDSTSNQTVGTYLFGVMNGVAIEAGISPVEVQSAMIQVAHKKVGYPIETAAELSEYCIKCAGGKFNQLMFAIIMRGMQGYELYKQADKSAFEADFKEVLDLVMESE